MIGGTDEVQRLLEEKWSTGGPTIFRPEASQACVQEGRQFRGGLALSEN